jgi:serine/threonine-protein phosphatase PP1 catalytic subunit
VHG